jgi:hypothetical protein
MFLVRTVVQWRARELVREDVLLPLRNSTRRSDISTLPPQSVVPIPHEPFIERAFRIVLAALALCARLARRVGPIRIPDIRIQVEFITQCYLTYSGNQRANA